MIYLYYRKNTSNATLDWTTQYLYDDNGITAFKVKPSTSNTATHTSEYLQDGYFIFKVTTDATGNIVRLDGSNGSMLKIDYDAFGKPYYSNEKSFGYDTNNQYDLKHFFKLGFKGYYYADESGLYYTGSRYYNPVSGRYISPDNVNNMSLTTRDGLSLYSYSYNNPIKTTTGIKAVDAKHSTQKPITHQEWFATDNSIYPSLSNKGADIAHAGISLLKGTLFLDYNQERSLSISFLNIGTTLGQSTSGEFIAEPYLNLFQYTFDGKYIDISFSVFNFESFNKGKWLEFFVDFYISVDLIAILENIFGALNG